MNEFRLHNLAKIRENGGWGKQELAENGLTDKKSIL